MIPKNCTYEEQMHWKLLGNKLPIVKIHFRQISRIKKGSYESGCLKVKVENYFMQCKYIKHLIVNVKIIRSLSGRVYLLAIL